MFDHPAIWWIIVISIGLYIGLRNLRGSSRSVPKQRVARHSPREVARTVPTGRDELTRHIRQYLPEIRGVKKRPREQSPVTKAWLRLLAERICQYGVHTQNLSLEEKFAVIFLVNKLFHEGDRRALEIKNFVQRTILIYHGEAIPRLIRRGEFANTYEIRYGAWSTHLPKDVVEGGALERRGRVSARAAIRRHQ